MESENNNNNNENNINTNDFYHEDNSFNENGISTGSNDNSSQFSTANRGNSRTSLSENLGFGTKNGFDPRKSNPALGLNGGGKNNPIKGQKPKDKNNAKPSNNNKNPAKGQNDSNKRKNPLPGGINKDKKDNNNKNTNKPNQNDKNKEKNKGFGSKLNPLNRGGIGSKLGLGKKKNEKSNNNAAAPNLNQVAKKGLKLAWTAAPIQIKILIVALSLVPIIIILILILFLALFGGTAAAVTAAMCNESDYDVEGTDVTSFMCNMQDPLNGDYTVSSLYGWRNFSTDHMHSGIDLAGSTGTEVVAVQDGTVVETSTGHAKLDGSGYGNYVLIKHGDNFYTRYAHLNSVAVSKDDKVKRGQKIGARGDTGNSYGAHLHFEIKNGPNSNDTVSPNPFFGYSDQGYEECLDRSKGHNSKCDINKSGEARKIGTEGFAQICGKTGSYTNDNNSCCGNAETGNEKSIQSFINTFEGSGGYCDPSKTLYKAYQNSGDRVTIGHGITSDYISGLKLGDCRSVNEVDEAQMKAINAKREYIKKQFSGVELSSFQEDAMTSMAYNGCGSFFSDIAKAAKTGELKEVWSAMKGCTNGGMLGLERRRKAEFALYVTGDYSVAEEYKTKSWSASQYDNYDSDGVVARKASGSSSTCNTNSTGSGDIVERANQEYEKWNSSSKSERSELVKNYMEACGLGRTCNEWCAGFVSYILKETGKLENLKGYNCLAFSYKNVEPAEHHKQGSGYTPQPGDVIVFNYGHVALVESVSGKTLHYIGGNQTGSNRSGCWARAITKKTISVDSGNIAEFVTIG